MMQIPSVSFNKCFKVGPPVFGLQTIGSPQATAWIKTKPNPSS